MTNNCAPPSSSSSLAMTLKPSPRLSLQLQKQQSRKTTLMNRISYGRTIMTKVSRTKIPSVERKEETKPRTVDFKRALLRWTTTTAPHVVTRVLHQLLPQLLPWDVPANACKRGFLTVTLRMKKQKTAQKWKEERPRLKSLKLGYRFSLIFIHLEWEVKLRTCKLNAWQKKISLR